ncbi:olfactory receptor 1M1-like [Gastrophryne carolinensis]
MSGNFLVIVLVSYSKSLHSPMYFFLSQLSLSDILLATDIFPTLLYTSSVEEPKILFPLCIAQFFFFSLLEGSECFLLTVMSYDRYLAICKPLHYSLIMNHRVSWFLVITSWALSAFINLIDTVTLSTLQFCGPNVIDHYFCDLDPILQISCSDTTIVRLEVTLISSVFVFIPFFLIIVSYIYIAITIFKISSTTGRQKAFSTCSSHLSIVAIFYGTLLCVYLVPDNGQSGNITKFLSLLYTVVTPLMNPIIYSLRNKDLKKSARNFFVHPCFRKQ